MLAPLLVFAVIVAAIAVGLTAYAKRHPASAVAKDVAAVEAGVAAADHKVSDALNK